MIFSFSRLSLYEQCPYRFFNKYILGKKEPVTQPLALGKAVHKAIEDKINGVNHEQAILNGYIEAEFHEELEYEEISDLVYKAPIQKRMGETEVYFKLPLSSKGRTPIIQGYIDVFQPNGTLIDWKTNRVPYNVLDSKQIALYCWAISQIKNMEKVEGNYYFLRFRKKSSFVFNQRDMDQARKWALDLAIEINEKLDLYFLFPNKYRELFPAKPSRLCQYCPFSVGCFKKFNPFNKKESNANDANDHIQSS